MRTVIAYRNGEPKVRVPAVEINGVLRAGKNILINADLIPASGMSKETVVAKIKIGQITPEIEALGMHIGDNGNGLVVRWADEVAAEREAKAKAEYDALPKAVKDAREEREAISRLYAAAYKSEHHDTDDDQYMRACRQRAEADRRLAAWKKDYAEAAKEERKADLIAQAEKQEELAKGALLYDCDGWYSAEHQQKRHDEFMAKAETFRTEAAAL